LKSILKCKLSTFIYKQRGKMEENVFDKVWFPIENLNVIWVPSILYRDDGILRVPRDIVSRECISTMKFMKSTSIVFSYRTSILSTFFLKNFLMNGISNFILKNKIVIILYYFIYWTISTLLCQAHFGDGGEPEGGGFTQIVQ